MEADSVRQALSIEPSLLHQLPEELSQIFLGGPPNTQQDRLALAALNPSYTAIILRLFEPVVVDIAARWLCLDLNIQLEQVISAFARILPHCPYLRPLVEKALQTPNAKLPIFFESWPIDSSHNNDFLMSLLLSAFRLLSFDTTSFSRSIYPHQLQALLSHSNRVIRLMAVRCFCLHVGTADAVLEEMLQRYCGDQPLDSDWESAIIDFRLISFWEEQRYNEIETALRDTRQKRDNSCFTQWINHFRSPSFIAEIGGVLIPTSRLTTEPQHFELVHTSTVRENLHKVGKALLSEDPLLLIGQPGAGKTALVMEAAHKMGHAPSMITLHLNEQTDSKSLLGVYSTSSQNGKFKWQPGVLTQAAREGRWILIEDLDRAPAEVIAVILPLIENRELVIPSRREHIRCAEGFRILATMRSFLNSRGDEITPGGTVLGARLWNKIRVAPIPAEEVSYLLKKEFPLLNLTRYADTFLRLYSRITSTLFGSTSSGRALSKSIGLRDLMKFCHRVESRLRRLGIEHGNEPVPARIDDEILMDAIDCFAAHIPNNDVRLMLASNIAEELHIPFQKMKFCLLERVPTYSDTVSELVIGRETCQKTNSRSMASARVKQNKSFAATKSSLRLMEQAAAAIQFSEPLLLVGETGIGKTAVVQQLAALLNQRLTVVNLSQQSEASDLLGGYKPVNLRSIVIPLVEEFHALFEATFSVKKNRKFLSSLTKSVSSGNWPRLIKVVKEAIRMATDLFKPSKKAQEDLGEQDGQPVKKRKLETPGDSSLPSKWTSFTLDFQEFEARVQQGDTKFSFAFVQGKIVKALKNGEWVLLDEINLASPDTLESIASLLHNGRDGTPFLLLSEAGEMEKVVGHPEFRIFGAMNPATDAGKRDLAPGLRSRFTELYVRSPDSDLDDLLTLIRTYLGPLLNRDSRVASDLANVYLETKKLAIENQLTDGAGHKPHFSIRTLVRTLMYVNDQAHVYGVRRATYEGFSMSFLTLLSKKSEQLVTPLLEKHILGKVGNAKSVLSQTPREVKDGAIYVQYKHYWMQKGAFQPEAQPHYIITPFIERNLMNLVRASSTRRFPILLQGPTSSGKTSMVEHLAKLSGNRFVRINNHEHTDLQEYLGSYTTSEDGTLKYQDGVLVEALKNGFWIVLDELNLAPTDVLEALNRLLDDNRELFVPETQEVIRPHANFMLFATQNPAGLYGGRKVLSRAFRNRFLELHFDDIPEDELEFILKERSQIPPSFCTRIVSVYRQLSILRQSNRLFEQRNSFATLRDLFRWAMRHAEDREQLAAHGFMLLTERVRNIEERDAVKKVIEKVMGVKLDEGQIYGISAVETRLKSLSAKLPDSIVWTPAMRRLFILVSEAIEHNEPVLLVGETGCGKTQICQTIADVYGKKLSIVNAHINLETGDLIGSQRPVRNRSSIMQELEADIPLLLRQMSIEQPETLISLDDLQSAFSAIDPSTIAICDSQLAQRIRINLTRANSLFEWCDGSLVSAMKEGHHFLLDELSLADDSVLERLNSVLETSRTVLLAEKGPVDSFVVAADGFQFLGTMNPGGDYGKRELSAALRNRLTEIWVPELLEDNDILPILEAKVQSPMGSVPRGMVAFAKWFKEKFRGSTQSSISIRDLLAWGEFINSCTQLDAASAIVHGACLVYIDGLGANPSALLASTSSDLESDRYTSLKELGLLFSIDASSIYRRNSTLQIDTNYLKIGQFSLSLGPKSNPDSQFALDAPTTLSNAVRVARALQSSKPILLEGSPGVGKTTLVTALAQVLGVQLTRINLSEQTDLTDLFGSDVPIDGGDIGSFAWSDAPFLRVMQHGGWVLLDEMNLASQSVLEGLNSCLDHRQEVYISELGQTFRRHPDFVLFAAQNPHHQGGGRKGLPASFVNRFTVVYADSFTSHDLKIICTKLSPACPVSKIDKLVEFTTRLTTKLLTDRRLGALGAPWEVNLRDVSRWLRLLSQVSTGVSPSQYLDVIISQRFRTAPDRLSISKLYAEIFGTEPDIKSYFHNLSPDVYQVGLAKLHRKLGLCYSSLNEWKESPRNLPIMESMIICVENRWPCLLVGPSGCGKTASIRRLAKLSGAKLVELALNSDTDAMDLIGGFEQKDSHRQFIAFASQLLDTLRQEIVLSYTQTIGGPLGPELVSLYQLVMTGSFNPKAILEPLLKIASNHPDGAFAAAYEECKQICTNDDTREAGFEWTEGILIHAMKQGNWVVLDNANLCNATVLDRLNSLLEPNGCLIVNERKSSDGLAQVVTPHPEFRLFLTVDPQHGELSRAMRNRSVEVFFLQDAEMSASGLSGAKYLTESTTYRIRECQNMISSAASNSGSAQYLGVAFDHLAPRDLSYLQHSVDSFVPLWAKKSLLSPNDARLIFECYNTLLSRNALLGWLELVNENDVEVFRKVTITDKTEPLHPLINQPRLTCQFSSDGSRMAMIQAAKLQELQLQIVSFYQHLSQVDSIARNKKSAEMSVIERSVTSDTIKSHQKDSTKPVASFLYSCCSALNESLETLVLGKNSDHVLQFAENLLHYCWDLFRLTQRERLDDALFLTYLLIGKSIGQEFEHTSLDLRTKFLGLLNLFNASWKLNSGESMQRIWNIWRPATPKDLYQLKQKMEFENLRARYDQIALRSRIPIHELGRIYSSLLEIQNSVLLGADTSAILPELNQVISHFEAQANKTTTSYGSPHFRSEFETLCQYNDFQGIGTHHKASLKGSVYLLAGRASRPGEISSIGSAVPDLLFRITQYLGCQNFTSNPLALLGNFSNSLIHKFETISEVPLGQIDLLESEIGLLLDALAVNPRQLSENQPLALHRQLSNLFFEILSCHKDFIEENSFISAMHQLENLQTPQAHSLSLLSKLKIRSQPGFEKRAFSQHLLSDSVLELLHKVPGPKCNRETIRRLGELCVRLSIGLLHCYIPDRPFDPSLRLAIDHQRHIQRQQEKVLAIDCLRACELTFSSQPITLRVQTAEKELARLGSAPTNTPVTRPEASKLDNVQAQFTSILNSVLSQSADEIIACSGKPRAETSGSGSLLLQDNIRQIAHRLSHSCSGYDDITLLAVRFLQILDQGIELLRSASDKPSKYDGIINSICQITPFLEQHLPELSQSTLHTSEGTSDAKLELDIHRLLILGAAHNIDTSTLPEHSIILHDILHRGYVMWKERLEQDQSQELEKARLYHYRGSFEDDEREDSKEMLRLFPTYDTEDNVDDESSACSLHDSKLRARFFSAFRDLFVPGDKALRLKYAIKEAARLVGSFAQQSGSKIALIDPKYHLAHVFLLSEDIHQTNVAQKYNFYTDTNMGEVKKFAQIVKRVQVRFLQLQESWPEHATLTDVLHWCSKIFSFQHREPLAKFLTMAEKLHGYIHEWQTVASKEFSAIDCYNELTSTLINWRRLELSTWSRLLDAEDEKAQEHAISWWFMAYEIIVAVPLQMLQENQPLDAHVADLLVTLEKFFHGTSMGQFSSRVDLVENLKALLSLYTTEFPFLSQITSALENLLGQYRHFISMIKDSLQIGRKSLEKDIKEQIQLASWKDTNITALRESARRSHHALFKIVRKYRRLLAQPCEEFFLREESGAVPDAPGLSISQLPIVKPVASIALKLFQQKEGLWDQRPLRFQTPDSTARHMCRVYEDSLPIFNAASELEEIVNDVVASIADFQKRTPKTLTKENKDEVQHLKTQKRSFYAAKLKELRHMGLRSNLGTDILGKQSSVALVLAMTPSFDLENAAPFAIGANRYFHRFLHILPRVRQAARNYSEDLSNVEASRSSGFTEGFLYQMLRQRELLAPAMASMRSLEAVLNLASNITHDTAAHVCAGPVNQHRTISRTLRWLPTILELSSTILKLRDRHCSGSSPAVISSLHSWKDCAESLHAQFADLPNFPRGLLSQDHERIATATKSLLSDMKMKILSYIQSEPDIAFALNQLLLWTDRDDEEDTRMENDRGSAISSEGIDSSILASMDQILVALQRVQSSLSSTPTSTDTAAWLSKTDITFAKSVAELHINDIASTLVSTFNELAKLSSTEELGLAIAAIGVGLPILVQFQHIVTNMINRYACLHYVFCKAGYVLAKSFRQVASEGFCSPPEPSQGQAQSDKVESGTGLGDGEGAEDISKDVQDDEDLSELAQQNQEENEKEDMEATDDAVNMDHEELEGQQNESAKEKEDGTDGESDPEEENDLDEEVGSVDGLDASAVDEKMWDGANDKEQKDTENEDGKGEENTEETSAAAEEQRRDKPAKNERKEEQDDTAESEENVPEDEQEGGGREDMDVTDPHTQENEVLDLPEDMDLDGEQDGQKSPDTEDGLSEISLEDAEDRGDLPDEIDKQDNTDTESQTPDKAPEMAEEEGTDEDVQTKEAEENEVDPPECSNEDNMDVIPAEDEQLKADPENTAPSDQISAGVEHDQKDNKGSSGEAATDQLSTEVENEGEGEGERVEEQGQNGKQTNKEAGDGNKGDKQDPQIQAFKKLGDILEQWHRSHREILDASEKEKDSSQEKQEIGEKDVDYEHLADDEDTADTQALGQANEEQSNAMNQSQAIESNFKPQDNEYLPDAQEIEDASAPNNLEDLMEVDVPAISNDHLQHMTSISRSGQGHNEPSSREESNHFNEENDIEDVDTHLSIINLSADHTPLTPPEEARKLWNHYESVTHDLSLSLTEQLRLILAPTMATKLRGDFRTGKRLNIKRIIPYIASQYKRDKIWMRRSVPSKRNYQIMLAVDDSKSMLEGASGQLAFQTLALVARSLSMLEAGDLCIVGFGNEEHIRVAHEFGKPFSSEAGSQVFQHFSYKQTGTNVRQLIADSVTLFREARAKRASSSASGDLWQLELIISDGICEDHERIAQLVRQAHEERIMLVFIIVDAIQEESRSILYLSQATFESTGSGPGDGKWKMKKYLDSFPFPYYLIVRNVQELPAVLSLALKQWFSEVVEVSS